MDFSDFRKVPIYLKSGEHATCWIKALFAPMITKYLWSLRNSMNRKPRFYSIWHYFIDLIIILFHAHFTRRDILCNALCKIILDSGDNIDIFVFNEIPYRVRHVAIELYWWCTFGNVLYLKFFMITMCLFIHFGILCPKFVIYVMMAPINYSVLWKP